MSHDEKFLKEIKPILLKKIQEYMNEDYFSQEIDVVNLDAEISFLIQYTWFELKNDDFCIRSSLYGGTEAIYDINVEYSDSTNVKVKSWKSNYDKFRFCNFHDNIGSSTKDKIYVSDLFPGFRPRHYIGHCWTR
jgi:hypothetical protein